MVDSSFYRNIQLPYVMDQVQGPTVIKAVDGHGGSQVYLIQEERKTGNIVNIDNTEDIESIEDTVSVEDTESIVHTKRCVAVEYASVLKGIGSSDVVIQPLTGTKHQDLRVYVIGKDIVAAVLRTATDGFKSNFSLGGKVCLYQLKQDEIELVRRIIDQFEFGLVGIDFILGDEGELIFNEIEDVVGSRMLYQCSDINIVELYLFYIRSKLKQEG
jgi:gamma-F420-2:alpha-L-glutamate ligase